MQRIYTSPLRRQRLDIWAPILLTAFAAVLRITNLQTPQTLVFDETYYVKDAWSQWLLGYTADWPEGADDSFAAGSPVDPLDRGSFSVHPPLGKWLIAFGMFIFGPGDAFGWRIVVALFGTATVLLVYLVAKTMTRSTPVALLAGGLIAIDGLSIVMSRIALLDGILAFFVLLAFWFVLLDRRTHLARIAALRSTDDESPGLRWTPMFWNRPWLIAAGAAAGAATAVKWSGLYALAVLGIYVVVSDALARRRAGARFWPADGLLQGAIAFVLMIPIALVTYLASWTGWLASAGGYDRQSGALEQTLTWIPESIRSLVNFHEAIYGFHVGLTTPHGYQSAAWQWPLLVRPTSMYWEQSDDTVQAVSSIPNPLIWWAGIAAAIYLLVKFVRVRDANAAFVLVGLVATYVPWLLYPERTIFQFYTIVMLPFLVIAIALAARDIVGGTDAAPSRRISGQRVVMIFVIIATLVSAFWYPVWTAMPVPYEYWRLHNWLTTWI